MAELLADAASGKLSAHVHGVYPLADYVEALGVIARREALGKVILKL
jgi:NADPH:quinone reductase